MHPTLNIAVKAARRAGAIINRAARDIEGVTVSRKREKDFVTEVDKAAEAEIIDILLRAFPEHAILAEESGEQGKVGSEHTWIIDPLDGTTNFIHGFPQYAVSIALKHKDQLVHGVIYDPSKNELFTASRGGGAFLNDRRIRVSKRSNMAEALLGTGLPFGENSHLEEYLPMLRELSILTCGLRRPGAAALDLAWVAAGRLDGFWEIGLKPWDMAAGALLVSEAGGLVADLKGNSGWLESGRVLAGNPKIFGQMLQAIAPFVKQ